MVKRFAVLGIALVLLPSVGLAQSHSETSQPASEHQTTAPWSIRLPLFIGYWTDGSYSGSNFGAGISKQLTDRIEVQADFGYSQWSDGYELASGLRQESSHFMTFSGNAIWNLGDSRRLIPYVGGGGLLVRAKHGGISQVGFGYTETLLTAQGLGGIRFPLNPRVTLWGEGRFHFFAMDETLASLSFVTGVSFCPRCGK
jgi:hypothetical protein